MIDERKKQKYEYNVEKIKAYQELCGLNNKEVCEYGDYKTPQWYGQVLLGKTACTDETTFEILNAISKARANKMRAEREKANEN